MQHFLIGKIFYRLKKPTVIDKLKVFVKGPKWTPKDVDHLPPVFNEDENGHRIHRNLLSQKTIGGII